MKSYTQIQKKLYSLGKKVWPKKALSRVKLRRREIARAKLLALKYFYNV
jgi:hypothetical protein